MYSYNRLHFSFVFAYNLYYIDLDRRCCNKSITLILSQKIQYLSQNTKRFKKNYHNRKTKKIKQTEMGKEKWEKKRRTSERNHPYVSFIGMMS